MGVWIETNDEKTKEKRWDVTPCVGVWIETNLESVHHQYGKSHPAWVCGLKQDIIALIVIAAIVTPCVGVWIETCR